MESELSVAIKVLQEHLKKDDEYLYSWQANIAMAFYDEYRRNKKKYKNLDDIHDISNNAAKNFLKILTQ